MQQAAYDSLSPASASHTALTGVRILFLTDEVESIKAGGSERELLQMIDICRSNGMRPHVGIFRNSAWLTEEIAGCPVTRVPVSGVGLGSLIKLKQWMSRQQFDILQTMSSDANFIGPIAGRMAGIPVIIGSRKTRSEKHAESSGNRPHRWQSKANRFVHQFIADSHSALEKAVLNEKVSRERISVVHCGIDLENTHPEPELRAGARAALGIEEDQILVGNVTGLRQASGVQMFINAAVEAYRQDPRLRFLLIGNGELRTQIRQTIHIFGMDGIIRIAGAVDNLKPYFAAFDFSVICSQADGSAHTLLESMASGVPTVATNEGGNNDLLGSSGLLVQPDAQSLADGILRMTEPELRNSFIQEALERVKQFDLGFAGEHIAKLYALQMENTPSKNLTKETFVAPRAGAAA